MFWASARPFHPRPPRSSPKPTSRALVYLPLGNCLTQLPPTSILPPSLLLLVTSRPLLVPDPSWTAHHPPPRPPFTPSHPSSMSQTSSSPCAPGSADHCSERACSSPALLWPRKWAPLLLSLAIALAFRALATQAQCTAEFVTCLDDGTKAWPTTTQHADDSEQCAVNFSLPACAFFASLQSEVGGGQCGWTDVVAGKHGPAFLVLEGVRCLLPVVLPSFAEPLDLAKPHDDLCPVDAEAPPDDEASDVIALHEASFFSVVDGAAPAVAEPDFEPCVSSPLCSSFDGLRPDSTSACRLAGVAPPDSNDAGAQQVHTALLRLQGTIETTDGQKSTVVHNNTTTVVHGRGHLDTLAPAPPPVDSGLRHPNNVVLSIPLSIPVCPTTWGLPNDVAVKYADSYSDVCASAWASPARAPLGPALHLARPGRSQVPLERRLRGARPSPFCHQHMSRRPDYPVYNLYRRRAGPHHRGTATAFTWSKQFFAGPDSTVNFAVGSGTLRRHSGRSLSLFVRGKRSSIFSPDFRWGRFGNRRNGAAIRW